MDLVAPLVSNGWVSPVLNLWLAIPIGFIFGFGLYHAGFTDSRKIASAFYLKDVGVPVVMFSAIVTGMLGLWLLGLSGFLKLPQVYFLPTYLAPMAVGGLLFGIGMAIGGFCPGTAVASLATGRVDAIVFVLGFLGGSLAFGDLFPVWGEFYRSDFRGVYRLDELFGVSIGMALFIVAAAAVAGSLIMRYGQRLIWKTPAQEKLSPRQVLKYEAPWVGVALVTALAIAFLPSASFLKPAPHDFYYIVQKSATASVPNAPSPLLPLSPIPGPAPSGAHPARSAPPPPAPRKHGEGC